MLSSEDLYFLYWLGAALIVAAIPAIWIGQKLIARTLDREGFLGRSGWTVPILVVFIITSFVIPAVFVAFGLGTPTGGFGQTGKVALEAKANHCFSCMCLQDLNWKRHKP